MAGGAALTQQTVLFVLRKSNGSVAASFARITDGNGRARIGVPDVPVPAGSYTVTAYFGGTMPLPSGPLTLGDPTPYTTATTANAQATVTVYVFTGFFSPVANVPVVNTVKAGSAVPVKFSLGYNAGLGIFASGYPRVTTIPCSASATLSPVKQTVSTTANSLTYDSTANQYNYTWKTDSTWAGTCRRLIVRFTNSADHIADFKLTN
jgi:hypothetical protein